MIVLVVLSLILAAIGAALWIDRVRGELTHLSPRHALALARTRAVPIGQVTSRQYVRFVGVAPRSPSRPSRSGATRPGRSVDPLPTARARALVRSMTVCNWISRAGSMTK